MTRDQIHLFLRKERERQKLSIRQLSQKAHFNQHTVLMREHGLYGSTSNSLIKWAEALDCEIIVRRKR